jgi:D-aminoacyl-tRNA deacylase
VEEHWVRQDVADLWAEVLSEELGLDGASDKKKQGGGGGGGEGGGGGGLASESVALVCIGGGHYAPKHGDVIRAFGSRVLLGHILASYALDLAGDAAAWQACVRDTVEATERAFSFGLPPAAPEIVCYIDKKAFKASHRDALARFIEQDLGLRTATKPAHVLPPPHASS